MILPLNFSYDLASIQKFNNVANIHNIRKMQCGDQTEFKKTIILKSIILCQNHKNF